MIRKKIMIVTGYPFSETVIKNRLSPLFAAFKDFEWAVELVTFATKEQAGNVTKQNNLYTLPYKLPNNKLRLMAEILNFLIINFYLQFNIRSRVNQTSVVFITTPSMFLIFCALPKKGRIRYVCDIRDLTWEYVLQNRQSFAHRLVRKFFILALRRFDYITVTNGSEFNYLIREGVPEVKLYILPNGIDQDKFNFLEAKPQTKTCFKSIKLLYSGNVGKAQNLGFLLDTFSSASKNKSLDIVGSGICLKNLRNLCAAREIKNVHFHGFLPWEQMVDNCVSADILIVSLGSQYKSAVPSKIFEYLTMRKPILYLGPKGACSEILNDFENVFFVDIDEPNVKNKLLDIINVPKLFQKTVSQKVFERNLQKVKRSYIRDQNCKKFAAMLAGLD